MKDFYFSSSDFSGVILDFVIQMRSMNNCGLLRTLAVH